MALSAVTAPRLGAHAMSNAMDRAGIDKATVEEAFMGHVVPAGVGQVS